MNADDPRHGTRAGYDAHRRAHHEPCQPCRDAAARYQRGLEWDHHCGRPRVTSDTGTRRRIQALISLGWTTGQIGAALDMHNANVLKLALRPRDTGLVFTATAHKVAALYDAWSMTLPPASSYATKARNMARRNGWVPPLAWDDDEIDDPTARPHRGRSRDNRTSLFDMAVVLRLVDTGVRPRRLTKPEAAKAVQLLREHGHSDYEIEHTYRLNTGRYSPDDTGDGTAA